MDQANMVQRHLTGLERQLNRLTLIYLDHDGRGGEPADQRRETQARHQKPVDRSDRRANREAGENHDRHGLVAAARDSCAENEAQRQDRADGKVDPAISTTSVWPIATRASGASCWPRRSNRAGSRNEGMSAPAIVKRTMRLTSAGIARSSAGHWEIAPELRRSKNRRGRPMASERFPAVAVHSVSSHARHFV